MGTQRLHLWSWEKTYRDWAGPGFTRIYVALHPFMQVAGLKANADGYLDLRRVPKTHPAHDMASQGETGPDGVASNHDSVLKSFARPRTWAWVAQSAQLNDAAHVERAIDSLFNRAKDEFLDNRAAYRLGEVVKRHDLLLPTEDYLSPLLEPAVGRMYRQLGASEVEIGNEMDDAAAVVSVDDFENPAQALIEMDVPARAAYSHDDAMQMLTISDFNAHHTLICLSAGAAAKVDPSKELEGFWASEGTSADWPYAEILAKKKMQPKPAPRQKPRPAPSGQKPSHDRAKAPPKGGKPGKPRRPS
jgi:hypothetical protein